MVEILKNQPKKDEMIRACVAAGSIATFRAGRAMSIGEVRALYESIAQPQQVSEPQARTEPEVRPAPQPLESRVTTLLHRYATLNGQPFARKRKRQIAKTLRRLCAASAGRLLPAALLTNVKFVLDAKLA